MGVYGSASLIFGIIENTEETYGGLLAVLYEKITDGYGEDEEIDEKLCDIVAELKAKYAISLERYAEDLTVLSAVSFGTSAKGWSYDTIDATTLQDATLYSNRLDQFLQELSEKCDITITETPNWYIISSVG